MLFSVAITESEIGYDIVQALLAAGFDANTKKMCTDESGRPNGLTPLQAAIISRKLDIAKFYWVTAQILMFLEVAINDNNLQAVKLLLNYRADPLKLYRNLCPLELAIQKGYDDIVEALLQAAVKY